MMSLRSSSPLVLALVVGCGGGDGSTGGAAGAGGGVSVGGNAGAGGSSGAMSSSGSGGVPAAGKGGAGGTGGIGTGGKSGASGAGGGAGKAGTAGASGAAGSGGNAGASGKSGASGAGGGAAGKGGSSGAGGASAGSGGSSAGSGGPSAGSGGSSAGSGGSSAGSGGSSAGNGGSSAGSGGSSAGSGGSGGDPNTTTLSGDVYWDTDYKVPFGKTLVLEAGTTVHVGLGAEVVIEGTLVTSGTAASPVTLQSQPHVGAGDYIGLRIAAGGDAKLTYLTIHDATLGLATDAGSTYTATQLTIDTSSTIAVLQSTGTITGGAFHGLGAAQANDLVLILGASPTISNVLADSGNAGVDFFHFEGVNEAPVFDHLEVTGVHCAFHFGEGQGATIQYSSVHDVYYGLMVLGSLDTQVIGTNLVANGVNLGDCTTGTITATGCYVDTTTYDGTCVGQLEVSPASQPVPGAGLLPLLRRENARRKR